MLRIVDDLSGIPGGRKVIKADDYQLMCDAQSLMEMAREDAQRIKNESTLAFEAQKANGYRQGMQEGSAELLKRVAALELEIAELKQKIRMEAAELISTGVRSVLREFSDEELVARIASQLVAEFHSEKSLRLRVHSSVIESTKKAMDRLKESYPAAIELVVVGDDQLETDGCVLESSTGIVDGGVATHLKVLEKALGDALTDAAESRADQA